MIPWDMHYVVRAFLSTGPSASDIYSVADPGFPVGAACTHWGVCEPLTWALFGENVCENERIGSHRGGGVCPARPLDPPMLFFC